MLVLKAKGVLPPAEGSKEKPLPREIELDLRSGALRLGLGGFEKCGQGAGRTARPER